MSGWRAEALAAIAAYEKDPRFDNMSALIKVAISALPRALADKELERLRTGIRKMRDMASKSADLVTCNGPWDLAVYQEARRLLASPEDPKGEL